ncbi:16S rRNA (cytidine(1402)-2'-O)-methyltransferase [Gayadomonas joobiniege]|uniref:16S rRNA (cytidine(1402)-2'-O)-methyltransferase n=1 Tax=Gayadomonas joobiniege TaxID=1234606 RepID=UPI00037175BD|nr:16S rRNA (cytidine(1402)-2'-O)-methyltransferase [Gayadomonas joobiniege]
MQSPGTLYVVATPIGNLNDITQRALQILAEVDYIAAEDTRNAAKLLNHFTITTKCVAYHDHNEEQQSVNLIEMLKNGNQIALISDAGTPLINDPGYRIVALARQQGFKVVPVPGCSAVIAALSAAGIATDQFYFGGFLPAKKQARQNKISAIKESPATAVFYESRHRILACLDDLTAVLGDDHYLVIARELTKTYESFYAGSVAEVKALISGDANQQKGEFVIMLEGTKEVSDVDQKSLQLINKLLPYMPLKTAAGIAAETLGGKKNQLYKAALHLNKDSD